MGTQKSSRLSLVICLALICAANGSSGPEDQECGPESFYCRNDGNCRPGGQRCTGSDVCINSESGMEDGCSPTGNPGQYQVLLGHSKLSSSSSSKKQYALEHQFITYRGFTYEFGRLYDTQILDINDPNYKYLNGRSLNSKGIESVGSSYCSRDDVLEFLDSWNEEYSVSHNNCQHFAKALQTALFEGPCNTPT